jgi:hypothetical protein
MGRGIVTQELEPIPSVSLPELEELKLGFLALFEGAEVTRLAVHDVSGRFPDTRHRILNRHQDPVLWGLLASGIRSARLGPEPASDAEARFTIWERTDEGERVHVVMLRDGLLCSASPELGAMVRSLEVGPEFFEAMTRLGDRPRITASVLPAEEVSERLLRDTPVSAGEALKIARRFARTRGIEFGTDISVAARAVSDGQRSAVTMWRVASARTELHIDATEGHVAMVASEGESVGKPSEVRDENEALASAANVAEAMGVGSLAGELSCRVGQIDPRDPFWTASWSRTAGGEVLPGFIHAMLSTDGTTVHASRRPWPRRPVSPITAEQALAAGRTVAQEILGVREAEVEIMSEPQLLALDDEYAAQLDGRIPEGGPQPVPVWGLGFDSAGRGRAGLYLSAEDGRVLEVTSYHPPQRGDREATPRSSSVSRREREEPRQADPSLYLILAVIGTFALVTIVVIILRTSPKTEH